MLRCKIKVIETKPPDVARDAFRDICKRAFVHIGTIWFKEMFPKHFTAQARHLYGHKPRSGKYLDIKKKLAARGKVVMGGLVDNVFSGQMMRSLKSNAHIRGFPTRGRVTMIGPDHLKIRHTSAAQQNSAWYKRKRGNKKSPGVQPDKKRELVTLTKQEETHLLKAFKKFVVAEFRKYRGRRKVVVP